jgi:hypothetical protein
MNIDSRDAVVADVWRASALAAVGRAAAFALTAARSDSFVAAWVAHVGRMVSDSRPEQRRRVVLLVVLTALTVRAVLWWALG